MPRTNKTFSFLLDGDALNYIDIPIWFTHKITNIGKEILFTTFWINEPYNPDDDDTYFIKV